MKKKKGKGFSFKDGDLVIYSTGGATFGAVVDGEPWELGGGHQVVNLKGLGPEYQAITGLARTRVNAAFCETLSRAPHLAVDGKWGTTAPAGRTPKAEIYYSSSEVWGWRTASGETGTSPSYEQARAAAAFCLVRGEE